MQKIMIASNNVGKIKEFNTMMSGFGVELHSLKDLPDPVDVAETGATFKENARLKAEEICRLTNMITIADDSGLMVDALDGRPGVYSARYAGPEKNDQNNMRKVLDELKETPKELRTARFVCVLAVAFPGKGTRFVEGNCSGMITNEPMGKNGFGYDPIFYLLDAEMTLAQMDQNAKNRVSHRAHAMESLQKYWPDWMGINDEDTNNQ